MLLYHKTIETYKYKKWFTLGSNKMVCIKCDYCGEESEQIYRNYITGKKKSPCKKTACYNCRHEKSKDINLIRYGVTSCMHLQEIKNKQNNALTEKYGEDYHEQFAEKRKIIWDNKTDKEKRNIIKKRQNTSIEKYGCKSFTQTEEYQEVMKEYWGDEEFQKEQKEKRENIAMEKYGVKNVFAAEEIKEKIKQTNLSKYGVENPAQSSIIKEKTRQTLLEKYEVTNIANIEGVKEKKEATNLIKYGVSNPMQNSEIVKKSIEKQKQTGKIKTYNNRTIIEWANKKGISRTHAGMLLKKYGVDFLNKYEKSFSDLEIYIKSILDKYKVEYECHKTINKKKTDFTIENRKLILELDGLYWHSEANHKPKKYHLEKKQVYESAGYKPLFFRGDEISYKGNIVESIILNHLKLSPNKLMARKCQVGYIGAGIAEQFFHDNHLMSYGRGIGIGLFIEDELVSAAQFYNKGNGVYEISRFCNKVFHNIPGAFSRILSFFEKEYNPKQIITFVDCRYGFGAYLPSLGFEYIHTYLSFQWTDSHVCYHRMAFPKSTGYDEGLCKIWDCGQAKFVKYVS